MLLFKIDVSSDPLDGILLINLLMKILLSAKNNSRCFLMNMLRFLIKYSTFWALKSIMEEESLMIKMLD